MHNDGNPSAASAKLVARAGPSQCGREVTLPFMRITIGRCSSAAISNRRCHVGHPCADPGLGRARGSHGGLRRSAASNAPPREASVVTQHYPTHYPTLPYTVHGDPTRSQPVSRLRRLQWESWRQLSWGWGGKGEGWIHSHTPPQCSSSTNKPCQMSIVRVLYLTHQSSITI